MPYVPPHLRGKGGGEDASGASRSLESLVLSDAGGRGARRGGRGRARGGRGPMEVVPSGMSVGRPCASYLDALPPGSKSLLGDAADFCDAFFHVRETPEASLPLCCVRQPADECEGRNTVIVARLLDRDSRPVLVARFHNRGKHHHAERVMMEDNRLLAAIRELGDAAAAGGDGDAAPPVAGTLSVLISLQPCHHSSSTVEISCTTDLFAYHARELAPRRLAFDLAIAYAYRSHWRHEDMAREELIELGARARWGPSFHSKSGVGRLTGDRRAVADAVEAISSGAADEAVSTAVDLLASARAGTRLLCARAPEGFSARAFAEDDWATLLSLADEGVRERFPPEAWATRARADAWTRELLDAYRSADYCQPCAERGVTP